jgi:hypothetical protein
LCFGRIGIAEGKVRAALERATRPGNLQHRFRDVDAEDRACRANPARQLDGRVATSTTDVYHLLASLRRSSLQCDLTKLPNDGLDLSLHFDPSLAQRTIPFRDLLCVSH